LRNAGLALAAALLIAAALLMLLAALILALQPLIGAAGALALAGTIALLGGLVLFFAARQGRGRHPRPPPPTLETALANLVLSAVVSYVARRRRSPAARR
jgi:membrane-bound ClpP family serine protease